MAKLKTTTVVNQADVEYVDSSIIISDNEMAGYMGAGYSFVFNQTGSNLVGTFFYFDDNDLESCVVSFTYNNGKSSSNVVAAWDL